VSNFIMPASHGTTQTSSILDIRLVRVVSTD
jgi:hypothetical protein